jgi:hypothetical protein
VGWLVIRHSKQSTDKRRQHSTADACGLLV